MAGRFLHATIQGSLLDQMKAEVREVSAGLRRAVDRTGKQVQTLVRQQAKAAGFRDGGRAIANSWRLKTFPRPGTATFNPAAEVASNMPLAVETFDKGATVTVKRREWLVWPTGFNATAGRRNAGRGGGMRVTPEQMLHASRGEAFVIRARHNPRIALWCLRVRAATGLRRGGKRGAGRLRLFVGGHNVEVATGKVKGQGKWRQSLLRQGFVPMFFMAKKVTLRKRLDLEGVRRSAAGLLATNVAQELRR